MARPLRPYPPLLVAEPLKKELYFFAASLTFVSFFILNEAVSSFGSSLPAPILIIYFIFFQTSCLAGKPVTHVEFSQENPLTLLTVHGRDPDLSFVCQWHISRPHYPLHILRYCEYYKQHFD